MAPHPFTTLSSQETIVARDVILSLHKDTIVNFREIYLQEPAKEVMKQYLDLEHAARPGQSQASKRPPRLAKCQYDVIGSDKTPVYNESVIDVEKKTRVKHATFGNEHQAALAMWEFADLVEACERSELFKKAAAEFKLPEGFEWVIEPW